MKKLAIVTTHPIQYNAPWFKLLTENGKVLPKVFYTWGQLQVENKFDPGFGKSIKWDIPLLEGYQYIFVKNIASNPGSHHRNGIINPSLIYEIEQWQPDAVLVFGWNFISHLKCIKYFHKKKPVFFRGDSTLIDETKGLKAIIRHVFLKWVYSYIDIALYVGIENKAYYKALGLKENQLCFAPHAIDNNRFMINSFVSGREKLGISKDAVVFLFSGKFESKKNPLLLMEAFIQLNTPKAYLVMVGNGELEKQLKNIAAGLKDDLKKRIHFLPFQNQMEMPNIYRICDVLVLPSQGPGETWGLAVNEAMACNKAVLVSDKCGCVADIVKNGINGYSFKNRNLEDLLYKMNLLLIDSERLKKMGDQSSDIIQKYNYEKICTVIENSLLSIVQIS